MMQSISPSGRIDVSMLYCNTILEHCMILTLANQKGGNLMNKETSSLASTIAKLGSSLAERQHTVENTPFGLAGNRQQRGMP
jgi:hypothetical protein